MANNNIEIEIQVNVENSEPLLKFLQENGEFKKEVRQIDDYFSPAYDDFLSQRPVAKWLRLRNAGEHFFINYKNWHFTPEGQSHYCDEFETKIEDLDKTKKILEALNFKIITTVDKTRKIWEYQDYEIAIDSVASLGDFVEIEYIGQEDKINPEEVTAKMISFLKNIGVGKITRNHVGYPFLLLFPDEVKYEIID
jgi:predicted adenylyl cyclase CyaB